MSEKRAFTLLKRALVTGRADRRLDRVENAVGTGWPDANGCFAGVEFWCEIKEPTEPKRITTPLFGSNHKLSIEQRNWIKRQLMAGGLVYVYINTGRWRILMSGAWADNINDMTLFELRNRACWHAAVPFRDDRLWEGIAHVIAARQI